MNSGSIQITLLAAISTTYSLAKYDKSINGFIKNELNNLKTLLPIKANFYATVSSIRKVEFTTVSGGYLLKIPLNVSDPLSATVTFRYVDRPGRSYLRFYHGSGGFWTNFIGRQPSESIWIDNLASITLRQGNLRLEMNVDMADPFVHCQLWLEYSAEETFNVTKTGGVGFTSAANNRSAVPNIQYTHEHKNILFRTDDSYRLQVKADSEPMEEGAVKFHLEDSDRNATNSNAKIWRSAGGVNEIKFYRDTNTITVAYNNYSAIIESNFTEILTGHLKAQWTVEDGDEVMGLYCGDYEALAMRPLESADRWEAQILRDGTAVRLENGQAYYSDRSDLSFAFEIRNDTLEFFLSATIY